MKKKLDGKIQRLAFKILLNIDVSEDLKKLIQMYGSDLIEQTIVRNGLGKVLMQTYYETMKTMEDTRKGRKERHYE